MKKEHVELLKELSGWIDRFDAARAHNSEFDALFEDTRHLYFMEELQHECDDIYEELTKE